MVKFMDKGVAMNTSDAGLKIQAPLYGASEESYKSAVGSFNSMNTTKHSTASWIHEKSSSADFSDKPKLKDRLIYPFKAIRNRLYTAMLNGGSAGVFLGMGIGIGLGAPVGFAAGIIPQLLGLLVFSFEPYVLAGALVGTELGMRSGTIPGFGIGAATALASVAIGLIVSVVHLPRDIYHAATLDKPRLDAPLPQKPWLAEKLSQKLSSMSSDRGRTPPTHRDPLLTSLPWTSPSSVAVSAP